MRIKRRTFKNRDCCGNHELFQLDGWTEDDWLCNDCFLNELISSEAAYEVFPRHLLINQKIAKFLGDIQNGQD